LGGLGDGGPLLTNNAQIATQAKELRNYGQSALYVHSSPGLNSRLDEVQAAILREAFLPNLQNLLDARRNIARRYQDSIDYPSILLLKPANEMGAVWHLFPVIIAQGMRDNLREHLRSLGILTGVHYPSIIPDQEALLSNGSYQSACDPIKARAFAGSELSLPVHPFLEQQEVSAVIEACNQWKP
jgi:dTDP-4-amino-4,6-dideoxygalactose transaminase